VILQPGLPDTHASGRLWSSEELTALAAGWRDIVDEVVGTQPYAVAVTGSAEGLALLAAASARRAPVVVFGETLAGQGATLPRGMRVMVPPSLVHTADACRAEGLRPFLLPVTASSRAPFTPLQTDGFVIFTSGSTGVPKPVFRPARHVMAGAMARAQALGLRAGDGLAGGVSFSSGQGVVHAVTAMLLRGRLRVLGRVDYREVVSAVEDPLVACWRVSAQFADVLGRVPLERIPRMPSVCLVSSALGDAVYDRFERRFGVPLRGVYSSTETGAIAVDAAPASEVVRGTVGHPLPGVSLAIGDHPSTAGATTGTPGRVWVRSSWQMAGYGVPPSVARPGEIDGWWPTRDLASLDPDGRVRLRGRLDDCVRTREGRLVNLEAVAERIRDVDGVSAVVVVPMSADVGVSFGVVVESDEVDVPALRERLGRRLDEWARPRAFRVVPGLPRLDNGKPDRLACLALLSGAPV
jgi:acyl-coenzyme A synthetase/AMP-(fatty) acid ligase